MNFLFNTEDHMLTTIAKSRDCSVEKTLDILGDRWVFLILREAFFGVHYYDIFQANLGISTNTLSQRLKALVTRKILKKIKDETDARRSIYQLTEKGLDLYGVTLSLISWGDRWLNEEDNVPLELYHKPCQHKLTTEICCKHCKEKVYPHDVKYKNHRT
jgi:DNA-binding HxlR family transcriptional regulator